MLVPLFFTLNILKQVIFNQWLLLDFLQVRGYAFNIILTSTITVFIFAVFARFKYGKQFLVMGYMLQSVYFIVNYTYYKSLSKYLFFGTLFSSSSEAYWLLKRMAVPYYWQQILLLIDLPLFLWLIYRNNGLHLKAWQLKYPLFVFLLLLSAATYKKRMPWQLFSRDWFGSTAVIRYYGLLPLQIMDYVANGKEKYNYKFGQIISGKQNNNHPNIVLIQVESLDAAIIGKKYDGRLITPFLTSLSRNSTYYKYCLSYHFGGNTSDAEFSTINNTQPLHNSVALKQLNNDYDNSFVKILKNGGYNTIAFHNNDSSFYNRSYAYPLMGYDDFIDYKKMGLGKDLCGTDEELFQYVGNKMKEANTPFFYHIITLSSHEPYMLVKLPKSTAFDGLKDDTLRNYYKSINYVDGQIENFFSKVNKENTYFIIVGDHTPLLSDHYKSTQSKISHDNKVFEFVPLLVISPQNKYITTTYKAASFLDIGPTILNISGLQFSYKAFGENLLKRDGLIKDIPFMELQYDRKTIYNRIDIYVKETN